MIFMGKTFKNLPEDGKGETLSILRKKLADRKQQNLRLKNRIRELEKQLEKAGKPVKESDQWQKKQKEVVSKEQQIKDLRAKLKQEFCGKNTSS
jgi:DNA repair exonuclease SbcCD ATPase subunit